MENPVTTEPLTQPVGSWLRPTPCDASLRPGLRLGWTVVASALLLTMLLVAPAISQVERVVDGDFEDASDLGSWPVQPTLTVSEWSSEDWDDAPANGSVMVTYSGGNGTSGGVTQCASVDGFDSFTASARTKVNSGQLVTGYFALFLQFFATADCSTGTLGVIDLQGLSFVPGEFDVWQLVEFDGLATALAQSVSIQLRAFKSTLDPGDISVFVDAVSFVTDATLIFADGFESGTTAAWAP